MTRLDRILGACIEPYCRAEYTAARAIDALVAAVARRSERVRAWCEPDRIGALFDPCPDFGDDDE